MLSRSASVKGAWTDVSITMRGVWCRVLVEKTERDRQTDRQRQRERISVYVCVRACVCACVRTCVRVCVCVFIWIFVLCCQYIYVCLKEWICKHLQPLQVRRATYPLLLLLWSCLFPAVITWQNNNNKTWRKGRSFQCTPLRSRQYNYYRWATQPSPTVRQAAFHHTPAIVIIFITTETQYT